MLPIILTTFLIALFLIAFTVVSFIEKETKAGKRSLLLSGITLIVLTTLAVVPFQLNTLVFNLLFSIFCLLLIILLLPIKGKYKPIKENATLQFDERDTMFSRLEISRKPEFQNEYYKNKADKLELDKEWHNKPGLMSERAALYNPLSFKASDASFFAIEQLRTFVDGEINAKKTEITAEKASLFIKNWSKKLGAVSVGFCKMQNHHYYSVGGRADRYAKTITPKHKFGIAITVEMDKAFLASGPAGATLMESAQQYLNSGSIAIQIAKFIQNMGYSARAHIDGNYELICPTVARDAGLGEIGRMGLLMTPELGPRVRIAVVTTNIPLIINERKPDYSVQHFCNICKKCADVCPSQAIANNEKTEINGVLKWQVNHEKCFSYWCTSGTDCGRCMSVCPYSHPNNTLHNFVRWAIKNNILFRHLALKMDDFFYGRKPKPKDMPEWMKL